MNEQLFLYYIFSLLVPSLSHCCVFQTTFIVMQRLDSRAQLWNGSCNTCIITGGISAFALTILHSNLPT